MTKDIYIKGEYTGRFKGEPDGNALPGKSQLTFNILESEITNHELLETYNLKKVLFGNNIYYQQLTNVSIIKEDEVHIEDFLDVVLAFPEVDYSVICGSEHYGKIKAIFYGKLKILTQPNNEDGLVKKLKSIDDSILTEIISDLETIKVQNNGIVNKINDLKSPQLKITIDDKLEKYKKLKDKSRIVIDELVLFEFDETKMTEISNENVNHHIALVKFFKNFQGSRLYAKFHDKKNIDVEKFRDLVEYYNNRIEEFNHNPTVKIQTDPSKKKEIEKAVKDVNAHVAGNVNDKESHPGNAQNDDFSLELNQITPENFESHTAGLLKNLSSQFSRPLTMLELGERFLNKGEKELAILSLDKASNEIENVEDSREKDTYRALLSNIWIKL